MADVDIYLWDVERGDAILIKGPKENAVIDLGSHRGGFSPSKHIYQNHGVTSIDYLVLTHPDSDHIDDLPAFMELYNPRVVAKREDALPYLKRRKKRLYRDDDEYQRITDAYLRVSERYANAPKFTPRDPNWNAGLTIHHNMLPRNQIDIKPVNALQDGETVNLNNFSIVSIVRYGNFQMITMGDLEENAIERLLQSSDFIEMIRGTDILIAPHHGRDSSYTAELFHYISPDLVAISDAQAGSTNASSKYSHQASGVRVRRRNSSSTERNVVTTRENGVIYFGVNKHNYTVRID